MRHRWLGFASFGHGISVTRLPSAAAVVAALGLAVLTPGAAAQDPRVSRVVDIKTPGSGEVARNRWENLALLTPRDQVKFVLCDRADYESVVEMLFHTGSIDDHARIVPVVLAAAQAGLQHAGVLADVVGVAHLLAVQLRRAGQPRGLRGVARRREH